MTHPTKQTLLDVGLAMLLEHGYHGLGVQALLDAARTPKGSFYHHFEDKQDFALQVVDHYMTGVHAALDTCLTDESRPPLERVRRFFETVAERYEQEGYLGCLLGGLGQELSGANVVFRTRIDRCLAEIGEQIASCLELARERGDIPAEADTGQMALLLVDCWEGAALRSRLRGNSSSLVAMLDFYFQAAVGGEAEAARPSPSRSSRRRSRA